MAGQIKTTRKRWPVPLRLFFPIRPQGPQALGQAGKRGPVRNFRNRCLLSPWILFPDTCMRNRKGRGEGHVDRGAEQAPVCQAVP